MGRIATAAAADDGRHGHDQVIVDLLASAVRHRRGANDRALFCRKNVLITETLENVHHSVPTT